VSAYELGGGSAGCLGHFRYPALQEWSGTGVATGGGAHGASGSAADAAAEAPGDDYYAKPQHLPAATPHESALRLVAELRAQVSEEVRLRATKLLVRFGYRPAEVKPGHAPVRDLYIAAGPFPTDAASVRAALPVTANEMAVLQSVVLMNRGWCSDRQDRCGQLPIHLITSVALHSNGKLAKYSAKRQPRNMRSAHLILITRRDSWHPPWPYANAALCHLSPA